MRTNKDVEFYSLNDIVRILRFLLIFLIKKWHVLFLATLIGAGVGAVCYYFQKSKYEAECSFILEEKQGGAGGLSSLASQFGFDMGGFGAGGSIFAGDNILDILKSKKVVQQVLLTSVDSTVPNSQTLADSYLEFSGLKKAWESKEKLSSISFQNNKHSLSPVQDSVMNIIYGEVINKNLVAERANKKGTIIKIQMTSENSLFARLMAERLVEEASKLYLKIKTENAQANINSIQRRSDSLLMLLNHKTYTAAVTQPLDVNPGIKSAIVPVEISMRDKTVIATLYAEVTKNLEASKLLLSQQTPIIQVLDRPALLLKDGKKGILFLTVVFAFAATLVATGFVSVVYFINQSTSSARKHIS